jgi:hypothetical protein
VICVEYTTAIVPEQKKDMGFEAEEDRVPKDALRAGLAFLPYAAVQE